jgi:hemerythrin-like metal-binding protein/diguanylate cyclase (GGDEF)-like protein
MSSANVSRSRKGRQGIAKNSLRLSSSSSLKLLLGPDLRILDASPAAAAAWARTREKLLGMDFSKCFTNPEAARFMHACAVKKGRTQRHLLELRPRSGGSAVLYCNAARLLGSPSRVLVTARPAGLPVPQESSRLPVIAEEQDATDPLTEAMSRKQFEEKGFLEIMRSDRYGTKLSLVRIGLDRSKMANLPGGHSEADRIMREFCNMALKTRRVNDLLGRWENDGLAVLLPETGPTGAHLFAERLRSTLHGLQSDGGPQVTASMGIAAYRENEELASMVERAEASLAQATQSGGNCVVDDPEDMQREMAGMLSYPQLINLHWRASYLSGEPIIDAEHKQLFHLANRVIAAIAEDGTGAGLLPLVRTVIDHVGTHFAHEEELLKAAAYPMAERHAKTHGRLAERANALAGQFESGEGSIADLLGFLIHDFVASHILQEDRKFFPWLKANRG